MSQPSGLQCWDALAVIRRHAVSVAERVGLPGAKPRQYIRGWKQDRLLPDGCSGPSQPVFGPDSPDLLIRGKLAASRRLLRGSNCGSLVISERDWRGVVGAGKLKHHPGDIVLGVGWETACDLDRLIQ